MADTTEAGLGLLEKKALLRPDETGAILRLSRRTIYRMIYDRRLAGVRLGRGPWRIKSESIQALLNEEF